jgi:hypothetical protein
MIRPGSKKASFVDAETLLSSEKVHGLRPKSSFSDETGYNDHLKRVCSNPLERLAKKLLDWDLLDDLCKDNSVDDIVNDSILPQLPVTFSCYHEYISHWEPLVIAEMKENFISNFKSKSLQTVRKGYMQFSCPDSFSHSTHALQCIFSAHKENEQDANKYVDTPYADMFELV